MRSAQLAVVALSTFALTRWFDTIALSGRPVQREPVEVDLLLGQARSESKAGARRQIAEAVPAEPAAVAVPTRSVVPQPWPASASAVEPAAVAPKTAYFIVIGFPIGIDKRNYDRRQLLRAMWYPEYPNLGKTVRSEFVVGLLTYQGDGHTAGVLEQLHTEHDAHGDMALVNAREATRDPYRGDPKCTGEKLVAWFQQVVVTHRGTAYFIKADWDTWIHTARLEVNLRLLALRGNEPAYFGNTLWCSYSVGDFQPCGYGFGPLQAAGARHTECALLPHGKAAIGPFPYTAGLMWGLSYDIVRWMAGSRLVYDFVHNASARFEPPYWVKGEDSSFGFFLHISPFKKAPRPATAAAPAPPPPPPPSPPPRHRATAPPPPPRPCAASPCRAARGESVTPHRHAQVTPTHCVPR